MNLEPLKVALAKLTLSLTLLQTTIVPQQEVIVRPPITMEEQLVRLTFWDSPEMIQIIGCESDYTQFKDGKVLTNETHDYGIAQINQVHLKEAKALGFDIYTTEGNLAYARYLYDKEGVTPWVCAKKV